jgi:hypothetical protein
MASEKKEYQKVPNELVECSAFHGDILGYTGEKFCDRPVILFRQMPGLFGSTSVKTPKVRKYTLHNGIMNQCSTHADGKPSVYWAVLDAMSALKTDFTKEQVIDLAVSTLVKYDGRFKGEARKTCTAAFYILKTHQTHPARSNMGFGFVIEKGSKKKLSIRARMLDDEEDEKPIATIVVNERG